MSEFFDDQSEQDMIQQMLDKIYPVLNDPKGGFYLPDFVHKSKYDPYKIATGWDWDLTDSNSIQSAGIICTDVASGDKPYPCAQNNIPYILDPSVTIQLALSAIEIRGLSNIFTERPICQADGVTVIQVVEFSTLSPPPFPPPTTQAVTLGGDFTLTLNCCCSKDFKTCEPGTTAQQKGTGTFLATIPAPGDKISTPTTATIKFVIEQIAPGILTIQATQVTFALPVNSDGDPSIDIKIDITSAGQKKDYNELAEEAFNSTEGISTIMTNLNTALNTTSALEQFSSVITNEIDGYLKQNKMYPFNNPTLAIF